MPEAGTTDFITLRFGSRLTGVITSFDPTPSANARSSERRPEFCTCMKLVGVVLTVTLKDSGRVTRTLFEVAAVHVVAGAAPVAPAENVRLPRVVASVVPVP